MNSIKVKDFSVSGEYFHLEENKKFGFLETKPQPEVSKLSQYYKSDDYISHTNTKRNLFEKVYHVVRNVTLKSKLKLINAFNSEEKTLLDIGCGTGHFLEICKNNGWNITGIEPDDQARTIANKKTNGSVYANEYLQNLPKAYFDVITLWHVLEHLPNLEEQVALFNSLLKPNGRLIIAVPNYKSYDAKYYSSFWAAYDVPRHLWHFNKQSIIALMEAFKLKVTQVKPMWFDAFYVSLLSEKNKSGKMNFLKGFFIGLVSNLKALSNKEASSQIYIIKKA